VVDDKLVDDSDFNNFFIVEGSQGQPRAKVCSELLNELNDRVKGHFLQKNPVQLINEDLSYFSQFNVVIANNLPHDSLVKLAKFCWEKKIALFISKINGFIGYLRVVVPEHTSNFIAAVIFNLLIFHHSSR
jgi:amyloid beta precursor protein binding protein 1